MIITARQIRQACALLGWRTPTLARRAKVGFEIVLRAQREEGVPPVGGMELRAIRHALERAGVEFSPEDGREAGVRLRKGEG